MNDGIAAKNKNSFRKQSKQVVEKHFNESIE